MKNNIILIFASLIIASCNPNESLESKKELLVTYNNQIDELRGKVQILEKEIALLDTSKSYIKAKLVSTSAIQSGSFQHFIDVQATVDSEENILINAAMPGLITKIYVKEGDVVSAGQILAEQDNRVLSQSISELETSLELAKTTFEKQQKLWNQKIGSEIQFLQAKTQYESLNKTKATLQTQLDMTRIKSPISGVVDEVMIKIGETAAPGFGVFRVVNNNKMKVVAKIADAYLGRIKKGDLLNIYMRELNDTIASKVSFVSKSVNAQTRTFTIEAPINDGKYEMRPNMLVTVSINDQNFENAIAIPSGVIQKDANGTEYVLLAKKQDEEIKALKKTVKSGLSYKGKTLIESGLTEGDMLITFGYQDIVDGQIISIN